MATRQSTQRNRSDIRRRRPSAHRLETAIADERLRLMKAHSVLGCLALALERCDDADADADRPYYPDVVDVARVLVNESIDRLDSVALRRPATEAQGEPAAAVLSRRAPRRAGPPGLHRAARRPRRA